MITSKPRKQSRQSRASVGAATASKASPSMVASTKSAPTERLGAGFVNPASSAGVSVTWGEAYRHECEVRFALTLPDKSDRRRKGWQAISKREYLEGVLAKRGQQAHDRLRDEMVKRWKASK